MRAFRLSLPLGLVLLLGCGASPAPRSSAAAVETRGPLEITSELRAEPLEGGQAWRIVHAQPIAANSLVYVTAGGEVVMADTPWTPQATSALLDWVERTFGRLPALATISHFHLDAAGGIEALRARGVPVVASTETARLLRERGEAMRDSLAEEYGDAFRGWSIGEPDALFAPSEGFIAELGGERVEVIFPGGAHTTDNVVTFFPATGLLFGGCMIKGGADLGNLADADLTSYADAAARVDALGARVVVAGHGDRLDPEQVAHTRTLAEAASE